MNLQKILSCYPKLTPHRFASSEDDPKEFILIANDTGAAIGLSYAEKQIAELMNGKRSLSEIIERAIDERIAPISDLRRFIWDMERYGFLEGGLWDVNNSIQGWGYWGEYRSGLSSFWIVSLLGPAEKWIGRMLVSPFFHLVSFFSLAFSIWNYRAFFSEIEPLMIQGSSPLCVLVVLLSFVGGVLFALWFGAMVLRAARSAPVRCIADYRYAIPVFRLDGRRLRAFPTRRAFHYAVSPVIGLVFLSGLFLFLSGISDGVRREGLFYITVTLWFVSFLLVIPWNSTLLSREVLLRVREKSVFRLLSNAVRRAFHFLLQSRLTGKSHDALFVMWGVWSIVGSLIFLRLAAYIMRWHFPLLINHFLVEENQVVLVLLWTIFSVLAAATIATMVSFFVWLGREIIREIRLYFWPERDYAIAVLGLIFWAIFLAQYFWTLPDDVLLSQHVPFFLCGALLGATSFLAWRSDGKGLEPFVCIFPFLTGAMLLVLSLGDWIFASAPSDDVDGCFRLVGGAFCWWLSTVSLLGWIVYWLLAYVFWFFPASKLSSYLKWKMALSVLMALISCIVLATDLFPTGIVGLMSRGLFAIALLGLLLGPIWIGWIRNYSTALLCAGFLVGYIGLLCPFNQSVLCSGPIVVCLGVGVSLCGFVLRISGRSKTALAFASHNGALFDCEGRMRSYIGEVCLQGAQRLYNVPLRIPLPKESIETSLKEFFLSVRIITGNRCLHVLLRNAAHFLPWNAALHAINQLPASIPAPRLTNWSPEKVVELLCRVPTFKDINGVEVTRLASKTRLVMFEAGEVLIRQDELDRRLFVVVQGCVAVEIERALGNKRLTVLADGDFVGEIGFLCGTNRTATVRATTPTLALCVHREDIDGAFPVLSKVLKEAEAGGSWVDAFSRSSVFSEFPPSLCARICLESRHVQLNRGDSLWLETDDFSENIAVFLLGKGSMITDGNPEPIAEGSLIGLEASLANVPMRGMIRAEEPSRILIVDRFLFREALVELLTPPELLTVSENGLDAAAPSKELRE